MTRRSVGAGIVFAVSTAAGVVSAGTIAWGHPILAARWDLLARLAGWAVVWALGVGAALRLPRRPAIGLIVGAGVLLRLAALAGPPTTSDDLYRYAWDGRVQAAHVDPYDAPPDSDRLAVLRDGWLWPDAAGCGALHRDPGCTRINRPAARTIYPPVAEAWFAMVYRAGGAAGRHKQWQVAGLLTDLAVLGLLVVALRRWNRDPRWVALYALSPVPVLEVVNNAHIDGLAIALIVAALAVAAPGPGHHARSRDIGVGLLIGAAALVKLYPAVLLAAAAGLESARPRRSVMRATLTAAALVTAAYLPHLFAVGWRVVGYLPGYLREEHYGGGRFLLAGALGLPGAVTTVLAAGGIAATAGWVAWRRPVMPSGAAAILAALFLATTPVQPWYSTSLLAVGALAGMPAVAAIALAGYPYFFAVILDHPHAVAIGRTSYAIAAMVLVVFWRRHRRGERPAGALAGSARPGRRFDLDPGERRVDGPVAIAGGHPVGVRLQDLRSVAGDVVPPHQDGFVEGDATEEERPCRLGGGQREFVACRAEVGEVAGLDGPVVDGDGAGERDEGVFEVGA